MFRAQNVRKLLRPGDDYVFDDAARPRVYSAASTLNVLRAIADLTTRGVPELPSEPGRAIVAALETPIDLSPVRPLDWLSAMLPPQGPLYDLIALALDQAIITTECIDRDTFWKRLAEMLSSESGVGSPCNRSFLALVYALLALGERYKKPSETRPGDRVKPSTEPKG